VAPALHATNKGFLVLFFKKEQLPCWPSDHTQQPR
jgi:hypothetical protein